jgi:hypothetical protein
MRAFLFLLAAASVVAASAEPVQQPKLTIHEWGTFTSLQDEAGGAVGGINSDDEPLPAFVHNLQWRWSLTDQNSQRANRFKKGYPQSHPDVTMRLETPVVYFHPLPGAATEKVDVSVEFLGGYLSQFYPKAVSSKIENRIKSDTRSKLEWHDLQLGLDRPLPQTPSHVWTTPRNVDAATVTNLDHETEKFLFYRGVGHLNAPLRLVHETSTVEIHGQLDPSFPADGGMKISRLWFSEFHQDGHCAFRELQPITITPDGKPVLASTPLDFTGEAFTADHLAALKKSMREALVTDGLNGDEADALLNTWELSYFKSPGTRLFFLVPHAWTEHYLPLKTSLQVPISRVMVGRIDLVTPEHRKLLQQIASSPVVKKNDAALWKAYDQLGRFRNALLINEMARHPNASLTAFMREYELEPIAP